MAISLHKFCKASNNNLHKSLIDHITSSQYAHGMSTKEEAGRRIRESRIKLGLTLKDVQQRANAISISRLSNWEQGLNMIDVDSAKELSKILNVSPGYLLTIDESPMNKQEQVLLDIYRQTDERGKASILRIAETESSYIHGHDETENNNKNFGGQ